MAGMAQGAASPVPRGWIVARVVDSSLEADLAAHILGNHGINVEIVTRGQQDFAVYVPPDQLESAARTLEPG
jgi:hypothetical protein